MSILKVSLQGQEIASLQLQAGNEYYIGRGSQCDIQLPPQKAISRKHLKVFEIDGQWQIELLSKFANLYLDGESVNSIQLIEGTSFSVTPFEFSMEMAEAVAYQQPESSEDLQKTEDEDLSFESPVENHFEPMPAEESVPDQASFDDTSGGATQVGRIALVPYLRILNSETQHEELFKLEGSSWIIGRHPSCEVYINDAAVSRRHFEVGRTDGGFSIRDLGSSNGIELNDSPLAPKQFVNLASGDEIKIRHLNIYFELRDPVFQSRMKDLATLDSYSMSGQSLSINLPSTDYLQSNNGPAVVRMDNSSGRFNLKDPKVKKYLVFAAPVLLVLAFAFGGGDKKDINDGQVNLNSEQAAPPSPEALAEAKNLFELAKNHYQTGKYEFCLSQIDRLHNIVPSYESSKDIENLCRQGLELDRINADRERKDRERKEVENKIKAVVENCKSKIESFSTTDELSACLAEATELSPENPEIIVLINQLSSKEEMEKEKQRRAAARAQRRSQGLSAYNRAVGSARSGNFKTAISQFNAFLAGNYGLNDEEAAAKSAINDIENRMSKLAQEAIKKCASNMGQEKYKDALIECEKALKIDPDNQKAEELRSRGLASLNRNMKSMYEDSILEESLGNLDAAKEKWAKIVEQSVPDDSYYKKAKSKLKKYGLAF